MAMLLNPYINFRDDARGAMEFYRSVFGGELSVMTFGDMPGVPTAPAEGAKVMHAFLQGDNGFALMAADTPEGMDYEPFNGTISLSGEDETPLRAYWDGLVAGGTVIEPLVQAPWGDVFGMCVDRFGVRWMVNITAPASA